MARCAAWLAPMLAAIILPIEAGAQEQVDHRWRIVVERDTMAIGPLDDVRMWAGLRSAKNEEVRRCVWELHQRATEVSLLRIALDRARKSDAANSELVGDLNEALIQQTDRAMKLERKARRRSPIVWGLAGAVVGVLSTAYLTR